MGPKFNNKCLYKRKEREVCDTKTHGGEGHGKIETDTGVTLPQEPRDSREPGKAGRVVGMRGIRGELSKEAEDHPVCLRAAEAATEVPSSGVGGLGVGEAAQERDHLD